MPPEQSLNPTQTPAPVEAPETPAAPEPTPTAMPMPTPPPASSWRARPLTYALVLLFILGVVTIVGVLAKPNPKLAIAATPVVATVHITSQGFQPATLVVKPGTRVIWTSDDSQATHLVASNPYPADNTLPSLKSAQLGNGAQFSYTFNHTGSYSYHDDLNPTTNGTIKVQ